MSKKYFYAIKYESRYAIERTPEEIRCLGLATIYKFKSAEKRDRFVGISRLTFACDENFAVACADNFNFVTIW